MLTFVSFIRRPQQEAFQAQNCTQGHGPTLGEHKHTNRPNQALSAGSTDSMGDSQGLNGQYRDILTTYWQQTIHQLENETHDYKMHHLPLARIKKVMKADPDVKMISAEAPILFAKGCDIFITELTMRAWIHAEENKRRTLQRSDIASALAKSDMFDFLIDIVPREEATNHSKRSGNASTNAAASAPSVGQMPGPPTNVPQQNAQTQAAPMGHEYQPMPNQPLAGEQQYQQPQGQPMYAPPVGPADPSAGYGQPPQMFDQNIYGYAPMAAPQQVR